MIPHWVIDLLGSVMLIALFSLVALLVVGGAVEVTLRYRRRLQERFTPPVDGLVHFHDGEYERVYADSPKQAIDRLVGIRERQPQWDVRSSWFKNELPRNPNPHIWE